MTASTWLPGLIVLAVGLGLGALLARVLRRRSSLESGPANPDLDLSISDLEKRRDDLYRRIRNADEDRLSSVERESLEIAAARTLRDLDRLQGEQPKISAPISESRDIDTELGQETSGASHHRPILVGFAAGAALMTLVGLLVYWAGRDAQPRPADPTAAPATMTTDPPHSEPVEIPEEVAAQIDDLSARLAANPDDWMIKKQLALTYMSTAQFFEAFELADEILQEFPEDPDALLVQGVVRMTMGQSDIAVNMLDRVLAQHPSHLQALLYRGLALYQAGEVDRAVDSWEIGLEMAGGSHPDFEEVLAMAQTGQLPGAPPPSQTAAVPPQTSQPPVQPQASSNNGYPVRVELAPGIPAQPTATLFVFLRPEAGGPPVAARRMRSPQLPIEFLLSSSDSMMGADLPNQGTIVAKLDADGSASTTAETDLETQAPASVGQPTRLVLGQ